VSERKGKHLIYEDMEQNALKSHRSDISRMGPIILTQFLLFCIIMAFHLITRAIFSDKRFTDNLYMLVPKAIFYQTVVTITTCRSAVYIAVNQDFLDELPLPSLPSFLPPSSLPFPRSVRVTRTRWMMNCVVFVCSLFTRDGKHSTII